MSVRASPGSHAIPSWTLESGTLLLHGSREDYRGYPPYFGASASHRYDAPDMSYGVLYAASDLPTTLMESVFHRHRWALRQRRTITRTELNRRMVRVVGVLDDLLLADLTAPETMAPVFGLNLAQLSSRNYRWTQRVSARVAAEQDPAGKSVFDGIRYPSRNNYPGTCVAIFDRAQDKVDMALDINLAMHRDWPAFQKKYDVIVLPR